MKKWLSFLALATLPFASAQASALPNVLAGLDNASNLEVMNDQQLSEVRGTGGPLPPQYTYTSSHYAWNFTGSQNDFRSYIYTGGSVQHGGKPISTGSKFALIGEVYRVTDQGVNAPMNTYSTIEAHTIVAYSEEPNVNADVYFIQWHQNFKNWNRSWNGTFSVGPFSINAM